MLIAVTDGYLTNNNVALKPFAWTKDVATIPAKVERCKASVQTLH